MKKQNVILLTLLSVLAFAVVLNSCKKDEDEPDITGEALFSYTADGKTVTFKNESTITGTVTYMWDFGDESTSTETNPTHTYAMKGEYTVTLTATDQNGKKYPVSTKVKVDKKTRIFLDDGTFDDWDEVTESQFVVNCGDNSGIVAEAKFDYDAANIYVYLKYEAALADENINSIMFDTDNDPMTGMSSFLWPLQGGDFLIEGQPTVDEPWYSAFEYTGTGGSDEWAWGDKELPADALLFGTKKDEGGYVHFEYAYARAKVPGLENDVIRIGIYLSDADWLEIGFVPDRMPEGGEPVNGFLLDMQ